MIFNCHCQRDMMSEQTPDMNCIVKELHFIHDIHNLRWDSFHFLIGTDSLKSVNFLLAIYRASAKLYKYLATHEAATIMS